LRRPVAPFAVVVGGAPAKAPEVRNQDMRVVPRNFPNPDLTRSAWHKERKEEADGMMAARGRRDVDGWIIEDVAPRQGFATSCNGSYSKFREPVGFTNDVR
jgi:hypothetical protein